MDTGNELLEQLCDVGAGFYARGYAFGSTGNLSVRIGGRFWITPTGNSLKSLAPTELACIDIDGKSYNEHRPSKEYPFHLAFYRQRADVNAIVHLHAPNSVALACLDELDEAAPLPAFTPYYFMRVAPLAVLSYFRPGSPQLTEAIERAAPDHNCLLLRNHGTVCAGVSLNAAVDAAEELEATAQLYFRLRGKRVRYLTGAQVESCAASSKQNERGNRKQDGASHFHRYRRRRYRRERSGRHAGRAIRAHATGA
jgi:3-dehydro-4-phosphotetronate decarboxylase